MSLDVRSAATLASRSLADRNESAKAKDMQAYMKTDMPFYGVQKPGRTLVLRRLIAHYAPESREDHEELVLALWRLPHREEKYLAQGVASAHREFNLPESLPLYRRMIVEGAWWDFVDEVATQLIRSLVIRHPEEVWPVIEGWIDDEDMWLRRAAIICQVGAKDRTDHHRLFGFCERRAHEKEFFIRKAIGWALREYAKTDPDGVATFVTAYRGELSGLSYREATKHIGGLVEP